MLLELTKRCVSLALSAFNGFAFSIYITLFLYGLLPSSFDRHLIFLLILFLIILFLVYAIAHRFITIRLHFNLIISCINIVILYFLLVLSIPGDLGYAPPTADSGPGSGEPKQVSCAELRSILTSIGVPALRDTPPTPSTIVPLILPPDSSINASSQLILMSLNRAGYTSFATYQVDCGLMFVTAPEHILDDGEPHPDRWSNSVSIKMASFSLGEYLRALFFPAKARFRVFAVFLTGQFAPPVDRDIERGQLGGLYLRGFPGTPNLPNVTVSNGLYCYVYIYEFYNAGQGEAFVKSSSITGYAHLEKSGILAMLDELEYLSQ